MCSVPPQHLRVARMQTDGGYNDVILLIGVLGHPGYDLKRCEYNKVVAIRQKETNKNAGTVLLVSPS